MVAGIAGIACAYYLSQTRRDCNILLIDKLTPLSLTTSMSGENFRQYWPQKCLREFVRDSINLMEDLSQQYPDEFDLRYSGYDFVSQHQGNQIFQADDLQVNSITTMLGMTMLGGEIQRHKPYLDTSVQQVSQINRAGSMDVYALGSLMLKLARSNGVKFMQAEITDVSRVAGAFQLSIESETIVTQQFIISAGPFTPRLAKQLDIELPVYSVAQRKFVMPDPHQVIPRDMPFTIVADSQTLNWSESELDLIASDAQYAYLLEEFPAGLHIKPEGKNHIKMGWAYNNKAEHPQWKLDTDEDFPSIAIRGASRYIPAMAAYLDNIPTPVVQYAGYYTRTRENLPLIGWLESNLLVVGALAGYGTMSACAAGSLCAKYISKTALPDYARYLAPQRYADPQLMREIDAVNADGQL